MSNSYKAFPQFTEAILTPNIRCGRDAYKPSPRTATAGVIAGAPIGFRVGRNYPQTPSPGVYHHGPGFIYLAKKPDGINLTEWDGDGDYFQIDYKGPVDDKHWYLTAKMEYNFTIPKTTPPGEYLMRVVYIWLRMQNESQFYVNCAQINVIGLGGGTPRGFAKFPGVYQPGAQGVTVPNGEEYYPSDGKGSDWRWYHGFMSYVPQALQFGLVTLPVLE